MQKGEIYINYIDKKVALVENAVGSEVESIVRSLNTFKIEDLCDKSFFFENEMAYILQKNAVSAFYFSKKTSVWKLFRPKLLKVGQIWEGALWNGDGKLHINDWSKTFKVRISALKGKCFKSVIVSSLWEDKIYGEIFQGGKIDFSNFGWRLVSATPQCYYCLCYLNENYLPLNSEKKKEGMLVFKCTACCADFKY